MTSVRRCGVLLLSILIAVSALADEKLEPCHVPGVNEEVRCGSYEVFENRTAQEGRKIALHIVVLPAKESPVERDPLVFLAGGGVAPATRYAGFLAESYPKLRLHRDILLVDQRGTGESNPLTCALSTDPSTDEYRDDAKFVAAVKQCRQEVAKKADIRYYTTPLAMDDLDDVRAWLGYSRLNLFGASYGTTAAMVYVRQHPDRVRTVALQGVIPMDAPMWLEIARNGQEVLDKVFAACAVQPGCHAAFPNIRNEFNALLERLDKKPVMVGNVKLDGQIFRLFVGRILYSTEREHDLPMLVHLAYNGDYEPLAERVSTGGDSEIPKGVYLSIVCSEFIPKFDAADLPKATAGTFLGSYRVGREITACQQWERGWLPSRFFRPVKSNVPVLLMNGAYDHVTPPRYGRRVAQSLPNSRHLVLPDRGHNDTDLCTNGIIEAFMLKGDLKELDTSCLAKSPPLTFALKAGELMK